MNKPTKKIVRIVQSVGIFVITVFGGSYLYFLFAATPNPGHPWIEIGDGTWAATGMTALRTFTFPDATSTILTTNAPVTPLQGGTGQNSTSSAMNALTGLLSKGDVWIQGTSIVERLASGLTNQILTANSAQSTGVAWSGISAPPSGSNTYIQFNDAGTFGAQSAFTFDSISSTLAIKGLVNIQSQSSDPAPPPANTLTIFGRKVSGRSLLKGIGPYGVDYSYQPSFFQNSIFMISTGAGTAYNVVGNDLTSVGTISHVVSEPLGYMVNQVTGAVAGNTAGTGGSTTPYFVGSQSGSNGFFFVARMAFPTATSTGARMFIGFTSDIMANSVSSDVPSGSQVGWQYSTVRGDTGWKFMTSDGVSQTVSSTILPMGVNKVFDFFIYCPPYPNNGTVYYRVDNITDSTTAEGSVTTNLPSGTTPLRVGFQLNNISAAAKNIRLSRLYVETDR